MDTFDNKAALQRQLQSGVGLPMIPDGPRLSRFNALELGQAIESEVNRAASMGHTNIKIDMTFDDALELAKFLRRGELLGA